MRTLPDYPSLEFLRREAKDVLSGLRESVPSTALARAQRMLAEQYGFRAWTDLKTEVERRRTSVSPGKPALARRLADAFGLGDVTAPMMPIAHEHTGRSWVLNTSRGRWALAPVFEWVDDAQAAVGVTLLEAARAAGVAAPSPVRSPAGRLVEKVDDRSWRADEWLEVGPSPAHPVRAAVARRVGETLGLLHGLAIPTTSAISPYLTARRGPGDFDELVVRARAAGVSWLPALEGALPTILELAAVPTEPTPSKPICATAT